MKNLNIRFLIKFLYFFPLFVFGIMHFIYSKSFVFMVPDFVAGGVFWVYFSGVALSTSSLAIIFKIIPKIATICLIIFVLTFILSVDIPGVLSNQNSFLYAISLLKDLSLLSGTCIYLTIA